MPHIPLKLDPAPLHKHIEKTVKAKLAEKTAKQAGSALKDSTKRLMDVLKKIRSKRSASQEHISIKTNKKRSYIHPISDKLRNRKHLAQSHKQIRKTTPHKGYREYLKREM